MLDIVTQIKEVNVKKVDFFQLIRLLNHFWYMSGGNVIVAFYPSISLTNPTSEIEGIKVFLNQEGKVLVKVTTNFFNIVGTTGVLPSHYTEYIISCSRDKDYSLIDFTNIFYNRVVKTFLNIVAKNDLVLGKASEIVGSKAGHEHNYYMRSLLGIPKVSLDECGTQLLLSYAGLLMNASKPVCILEAILAHCFQLKVRVEQFVEEKFRLENEELSALGSSNNQLGSTLYLGKYAYFNLNKVEVVFYDLAYLEYERILGDEKFFEVAHKLLSFYLGQVINYKLTFLIREDEKITFVKKSGPRMLGRNLWCKC